MLGDISVLLSFLGCPGGVVSASLSSLRSFNTDRQELCMEGEKKQFVSQSHLG